MSKRITDKVTWVGKVDWELGFSWTRAFYSQIHLIIHI